MNARTIMGIVQKMADWLGGSQASGQATAPVREAFGQTIDSDEQN